MSYCDKCHGPLDQAGRYCRDCEIVKYKERIAELEAAGIELVSTHCHYSERFGSWRCSSCFRTSKNLKQFGHKADCAVRVFRP